MRPKILLLHGALGSKKQLQPLQELLRVKYEVHTLDFKGHGESDSKEEYSIELFTNQVLHYLDAQYIECINVFGYSMGGYVALNTAKYFPNRINKIVSLGTKFDWSETSAQKEIKMLNPEIIESKIPHFAQKLSTEHTQDWKEVMHKTARLMLGMATGKKLLDEDYKSIKHIVTIGIGNADKMVSLEESKNVSELLPNASIQILEGVEHPIDKVSPALLYDYILKSI